jgi:clan AA aspartic protease (TIGR02281 family)
MLFASLVSAEVYKCVDNRKTTFSNTPCGENAQLVSSLLHEKPAPTVTKPHQAQSMALTLNGGDNYSVAGSVKGVPVVYVVDTGASMIAFSKRVMDQAGAYSCVRYIDVFTSNGDIRGCITIVPELTFGVFKMTNVEVSIAPNMSIDALLGMGALRHFKVNQQGGVMTISN